MMENPYSAKWQSSACSFYYSADGPGLHMRCDSEYHAKMIAAALNNAYLLGRLQYLESKITDVEIPVNTVGPEVGSN